MKTPGKKAAPRLSSLGVILTNAACVGLMIAFAASYASESANKIFQQNVNNISNLNQAAASTAEATFVHYQKDLLDQAHFCELSSYSLEQAESFLLSSDVGTDSRYEIIDKTYTGYRLFQGDTPLVSVSYKNANYYALQTIFDNATLNDGDVASFTPEFTDSYDAFKSFAFYTYVNLTKNGVAMPYTLLRVAHSEEMIATIEQRGNYSDLSSALIDLEGNYVIGNPSFRSANFFKYLAVFNNLSNSERDALAASFLQSSSGSIQYLNSAGEKTVFVYARPSDSAQWFCLSAVPVSSFPNQINNSGFMIAIIAILIGLLCVDTAYLEHLNNKLRASALREADANAAKTEFFSRMSHDMRTPLNAILGFTSLTRESPELPKSLDSNLAKIDSSGHYLLGLINDVLDMSKIESGKIELRDEVVDLVPFYQEIQSIFNEEAGRRGITFITKLETEPARYLVMDPLRMRQIYSNLISNAIKFSNSGTAIYWSVKEKAVGDKQIQLTAVVKDEGCGMSEEFLKNIFSPFAQEQNAHTNESAGTGLGLAIVKKLVDLMGGSISVESELGKGTTFTISLNRTIGNPASLRVSTTPVLDEAACLEGKHVLLCEDNELNQEIALALLRSRKMVIDCAENGKIGVDKFTASPLGYYDVILMDIRMPVLNGLEATKAIRALNRDDAKTIPIIAMTANAYDEDIKASLAAGMNAHLSKPFEPAKIFTTLSKFLGAETPAGSDVTK